VRFVSRRRGGFNGVPAGFRRIVMAPPA
jgi:hypothetical protein